MANGLSMSAVETALTGLGAIGLTAQEITKDITEQSKINRRVQLANNCDVIYRSPDPTKDDKCHEALDNILNIAVTAITANQKVASYADEPFVSLPLWMLVQLIEIAWDKAGL